MVSPAKEAVDIVVIAVVRVAVQAHAKMIAFIHVGIRVKVDLNR